MHSTDKKPLSSYCHLLGVSRSGYYAWKQRPVSAKQQEYQDLSRLYWQRHEARVGAPSLVHDMRELGYDLSERTVGRRLRVMGLQSKAARRYKATTDSQHAFAVAPNLLNRQFTVSKPNQVFVTDITYIRTQEGWLYLCVMIDLFHRGVVAWQTSERINRHLVCDALNYAMAKQGYPQGVMVHSDRGSQYASHEFKGALRQHRAIQSMSRKGNCWDNAVAESFFHTLKAHIVHDSVFKTRKEANAALFEYIETYYNRVRRHSANGWLSPNAFMQKHLLLLEGTTV